jgi:hypothetical protein
MKTYMLTLNEEQENLIKELAKALKIELEEISEEAEERALLMAMEEGKKYGRLTDEQSKSFIEGLGG